MRSNELRIGNWARIPAFTEFVEVELSIDNIKDFYKGVIEIKPIPLTEEWSVKFGYECLVDMACDFSCKSLYPIEITSEDLKLMKVNEAQNLYLDLTSEELTIKE